MSEADRLAEYRVDKTGWPDGPWMQEPDRVQWTTAAELPGLIVRQNVLGALCGYAAVAPGHPLHGREWISDGFPDLGDGIDYSAACQQDGPVCHVPGPGEPDDVWWFGFHCAHAWDYAPADRFTRLRPIVGAADELIQSGVSDETAAALLQRLVDRHRRPPEEQGLVYRTIDVVRERVECLARELAAFGPPR